MKISTYNVFAYSLASLRTGLCTGQFIFQLSSSLIFNVCSLDYQQSFFSNPLIPAGITLEDE